MRTSFLFCFFRWMPVRRSERKEARRRTKMEVETEVERR